MTKSTPLISIILPIYNAQNYLEKCIFSLLNQTFINIEILCINDGSTDKSEEILKKLSINDNRLVILNQSNSGPAKARNYGLKMAKGKFIMFCDSDDWYEPNMCELMHTTMNNQNVDIVACNTHFHEAKKSHNRSIKSIVSSHKLKHFETILLTDKIRSEIFVVLWNKIFKKELIDKYKITFPDGYEFDDDSFVYQYLSVSKNYYGLDKKLYNYLIRPGSIMSSLDHDDKYLHAVKSLSHTTASLIKNNQVNQGELLNRILMTKMNWFLNNLNDKNSILFLESINENIISQLPEFVILQHPVLLALNKKYYDNFIVREEFNPIFKFLGITFLSKKTSKNKTKYYVLSIPVLKEKKSYLEKKYYFLGIYIFKIKNSDLLNPPKNTMI